MAFAKQLAWLLGDLIWAESEGSGKGSCFHLQLSLIAPHPGEKISAKQREELIPPKQIDKNLAKNVLQLGQQDSEGGIRVIISRLNKEDVCELFWALLMVIDDAPQLHTIVSNYCEKHGYRNFIMVQDSRQAIEAIYQYRPNLKDYPLEKTDYIRAQVKRLLAALVR